MYQPFHTILNLNKSQALIRARRYGVIEVVAGQLSAIHFRPWPKMISRLEISTLGRWHHAHAEGDICRLFYNAPLSTPGYLNLAYVASTKDTRLQTFRRATEVLDRVAEIKKANATVCELSNERLSERLLTRWGWEQHCLNQTGRHFIKRYYGTYPQYNWLSGSTDNQVLAQNDHSIEPVLPCS